MYLDEASPLGEERHPIQVYSVIRRYRYQVYKFFQFQCIQQQLESEQCDLCGVLVVENRSLSNHSHARHFEQNDDLPKVVVQLCAEILHRGEDPRPFREQNLVDVYRYRKAHQPN